MSRLSDGVVMLWWADIDDARTASRLATEREQARASRFLRSDDQRRSLVGAVLLRVLAATALGDRPALVTVDRECRRCSTVGSEPDAHGRPVVVGSALHISLSHSGELICAAASWSPVGVDIEKIRPLEIEALGHALAPEESVSGFTNDELIAFWVRKESFVKATGEGLTAPPSQVRVAAAPNPRTAFRPADRDHDEARGQIWDLQVPTGYRGAVTVLSHDSFCFEVQPDRLARKPAVPVRSAPRS